jgi:hypothetical protein
VVIVTVGSGSVTAHALLKDRVTVQKGSSVVLNYGPLPQNDPLFTDTIRPSFCSTAPGCDTIPMTVIPPETEASEDHVVKTTLTWDGSTNTILALYLWDEGGTRVLGSAPSGQQPATVTLYQPAGNYNIVVHHPAGSLEKPSGPNTGYRLQIEMLIYPFDSNIFESLESEGSFGGSGDVTLDSSGMALPEGFAGGPAQIPFGFVVGDQDFAALASRAIDTEALAAGSGATALRLRELGSEPVDGALLGLSVGVFPVGLIFAGGLYFRRRASSLLEGV